MLTLTRKLGLQIRVCNDEIRQLSILGVDKIVVFLAA